SREEKIGKDDSRRITVDEYSSKQILAAYGVPVSREDPAGSEDEAAAVATKIGYPVVIKGLSPAIAHKTGRGLIKLNLKSEEDVRLACRSIRKAAGEEIDLLVSKMVAGEREVMAGIFREANFGPAVLFGAGGIFAEALADRTFRLAPLSGAEAEAMLDDIRSSAMLGEQRGFPAADRQALSSILQALGNIALLHPEIIEIDLNPIIIAGSKPVVADALVVLNIGDQH
ncbi:MAG: acetate--CoA ligase family protein, partial [Bacillota bacterium]